MEPDPRVALVTGSARRIGRSIALALADEGFDLAVHYRTSLSEAQEVARLVQAKGRRALLIEGDLAEPDAPGKIIERAVEGLGRLDVLINNASIYEQTPLEQCEVAVWDRMFRINVTAPGLLIRAAVPHMHRAGKGRVINLTDIYADRPMSGYAPYCASKAALVSLTRSLAQELAPGITVNAVAPGNAIFPEDYDDETRARLLSRVPLRREGSPEEIADAVVYLATSAAYVTGQVITVDGGRSIIP